MKSLPDATLRPGTDGVRRVWRLYGFDDDSRQHVLPAQCREVAANANFVVISRSTEETPPPVEAAGQVV